MSRYRFITLPTGARCGQWRSTLAEALHDAVEADLAEYDMEAPEGIQLDLMVAIQEGEPISEKELWACAIHVWEQHGAEGYAHIAERIETLTLKADAAGVLTWKAIAERFDQLVGERAPEHLQALLH